MTWSSVRPAIGMGCLAALVGLASGLDPARPASASWQEASARQVVMFGVKASPGGTFMDPKISAPVAAQLRRTLPGHGFKLVQIKGARVATGRNFAVNMGGGYVATSQLLNPLDPNGKVQMRFQLDYQDAMQFQSIVVTPADQFNFFDKMLPNGDHLLIGVGAR